MYRVGRRRCCARPSGPAVDHDVVIRRVFQDGGQFGIARGRFPPFLLLERSRG